MHRSYPFKGWRGSAVKARHFIIATQDYFLQKYNKEDQKLDDAVREAAEGMSRPGSPALSIATAATEESSPRTTFTEALGARVAQHGLQDRWAVGPFFLCRSWMVLAESSPQINYITLARARPILEAFDDDVSGWISVLEVNAFTSSRPVNYSVVKWLAFWARGGLHF